MALNTELVDIPITGGIDSKTNPHDLKPPYLVTADNVSYQTTGALRKRYGFTTLSPTLLTGGSLSIAQGAAIQSVNGELVYCDGKNFYAYNSSVAKWTIKGIDSLPQILSYPAVASQSKQLYNQSYGTITAADIGNYRAIAFEPSAPVYTALSGGVGSYSGNVQIGIWDKSANTWLYTPTSLSYRTWSPSLTAFGNYFYLFFAGYTSGSSHYFTSHICVGSLPYGFNISTQLLFGPMTNYPSSRLFIDGAATPSLVACVYGVETVSTDYAVGSLTDSNILTWTSWATVSGNFPVGTMPLPLNGRSTMAAAANDVSHAYGLFIDYGSRYMAAADYSLGTTSGTSVVISPATSRLNALPPVLRMGVAAVGTTSGTDGLGLAQRNFILATGNNSIGSLANTFGFDYNEAGFGVIGYYDLGGGNYYLLPTVTQTAFFANNIHPAQRSIVSKPYEVGYRTYRIWSSNTGNENANLQPTYTLQEMALTKYGTVIARYADTLGVQQSVIQPATTWPNIGTTTYDVPLVAQSTINVVSIPAVTVTSPKFILPLDKGAFITGARPTYYDGTSADVSGWEFYPEMLPTAKITNFNAVGSLTLSTTYTYMFAFKRYDALGRTVWSRTSIGSVPVTNYYTVKFDFGSTGLTYYGDEYSNPRQYQTVLYRNTASEPTTYYYAGLLPYGASTSSSYTDTISDDTLRANALLGENYCYVAPPGGELNNDPPSACSIACISNGYIFTDTPNAIGQLNFSKPLGASINGTRAPEFNAGNNISVDPATGAITGLADMDGTLIVFKNNAIYSISGSGRDATGAGGFAYPTKITSDTGCISAKSVLVSSTGVFFQSSRGIMLLTRGLIVQYIGSPIEPLIQGNYVTACLLMPVQSQARFWVNTGIVLVLDYSSGNWSTFSSVNGYYASSACMWNGSQVTLDTVNGNINVENTGFTDNGSAITMTVETPWLAFHSPQSWNRLRRVLVLGDYKSTNTATLYFGYDWNTTYADTVTFNTTTGLVSPDTVYQWRARAPRQVMQSVRLKLIDSSTSGESYDLTKLGLEYAIRGGPARLPSQKSV